MPRMLWKVRGNGVITSHSKGQKQLAVFTPFNILANNLLPLNEALCFSS